ncbi:MAG: hypothetical protein Q8N99_04270 [Nanoarchaeota archaeon]|nr:hypothetical protein [Nanoarchaeota archaeon]
MQKQIIINELLKKLEGNHTLESIIEILNENGIKTNKQKAIHLIYNLRKKGFVKTERLSNNKRVYNIFFDNSLGGFNYYEIINENSPIKLAIYEDYKIHGKKKILEEALIYALKEKSIRATLAILALFQKINNWPLLYKLAKKEGLQRHVGALYDVARTIIKTRKMTKRFRNLSLPKKSDKFQYIIENLKSRDFKNIEKIWKVYIPFNKIDLEDYIS